VREMRTGNGSIYNVNHVNICRALVRLLSERTDPSLNMALIGMYREQVRRYGRASAWTHRDLRADTVDAFEGAEADIVIVDLVRSNPRGMVGFLEVHNRINVAMSRAKRLLVVVGDSQTVRSNRVLRQVYEGFRRSGAIIPWHRLPQVGKGGRRRRRGRTTRQPGQRPEQTAAVEVMEAGAEVEGAPRRLPRVRTRTPPAEGAEPGAAGTGAAPQSADGNQPQLGPDGQPRRSRHRRRRRRPRFRPGQPGAAGESSSESTPGTDSGEGQSAPE
jgi:hypothetical protein